MTTSSEEVNTEYEYMSGEYLENRFNAYFGNDNDTLDKNTKPLQDSKRVDKKEKKNACQRKISEVQIKLRNILVSGFIMVCALSAFVVGSIRIEEAIVLAVFSVCLLYILEYSERKFQSKKESFQKACGSCFRKRQATTIRKTKAISNDLL
jgi:hypothetical protein|tara:strand:+ start:197 stop:649 length:453 start_codon:yes stop_codon:yes gene_type:complete